MAKAAEAAARSVKAGAGPPGGGIIIRDRDVGGEELRGVVESDARTGEDGTVADDPSQLEYGVGLVAGLP